QAELHADVARMAEVLARRIRTLVTRQLRLLDQFERDETDPELLARLFALDHLAARLRRNGENLLVLAGGEPGRANAGAYPLSAGRPSATWCTCSPKSWRTRRHSPRRRSPSSSTPAPRSTACCCGCTTAVSA